MTQQKRRPDDVGRQGEALAEAALVGAGLRILERRYRRRTGEIDLIAQAGELVVFVEVKTRQAAALVGAAESVTAAKRRRMAKVALDYLARRRWLERPCRFDVVEVLATAAAPWPIRHIEDAFRLWRNG